jgi:hypothetical protein
MIRWADVGMRDEGGFELVSKYQVTIVPTISSYFLSDVTRVWWMD